MKEKKFSHSLVTENEPVASGTNERNIKSLKINLKYKIVMR